jgi:hypothetical protein
MRASDKKIGSLSFSNHFFASRYNTFFQKYPFVKNMDKSTTQGSFYIVVTAIIAS